MGPLVVLQLLHDVYLLQVLLAGRLVVLELLHDIFFLLLLITTEGDGDGRFHLHGNWPVAADQSRS